VAPLAHAASGDGDDDLELGTALDLRDTPVHDLWDAPSPNGSLWVAVQANLTSRSTGQRDFGALLLVSMPLERLYRSRAIPSAPSHLIADPAVPSPDTSGKAEAPGPAAKEPVRANTAEGAAVVASPRGSIQVTAAVARQAVDAALRHAHLKDPDVRIDALATRARMATLLPELRLRATRLVDEAQTLSPTEFDPARVTASGGASLWLEARCTWRLDRLVFADEEMALERMRHDRAEAAAKLAGRVLELLFAWQRAVLVQSAPESSPEAAVAATLKTIEAEGALDIATGGWFSQWRAKQR
jgi:hypothetical protein